MRIQLVHPPDILFGIALISCLMLVIAILALALKLSKLMYKDTAQCYYAHTLF